MSEKGSPAPDAKPEHISLKIQGSGFPDLMIKVKKTTKLSKMMSAYCDRAGKQLNEVRFMFDGQKILGSQTVGDLDIDDDEDEVMIEVTSEAVGGR
ncbi:small ubiquitin-related modifier [Pseudohyphozyma bogoriensis]|nr:small ubiquitin-related modifier [Pseudohyphozyma bogoriensis]